MLARRDLMPRIRTSHNIPKNDDAFELLCLELLRRKWDAPGLAQYGKRGQRQDGIDLIDLSGQSPLRAAQCKLHEPHKTILPSEIEAEVEKAKGAQLKLEQYAILTTAKPSTQAQRKILEINHKHKEQGLFLVQLLHWRELEDLLDEYADVREQFYGGLDAEQAARMSVQLKGVQDSVQQAIASANSQAKSVLQEAKQAIEEHDYPVAKRLLERLRKQQWDELSSAERFQLLTSLGAVRLAESAAEDAAELFLRAKSLQPDDEKALTNEAFAYFLRDELTRARELAGQLRIRFPHSARIAAILVNSSAAAESPDELVSALDEHLISDVEVAVALAARFAQKGDTERAESLLRGAKKGKTEWSALKLMTGRAIVASEIKEAAKQGNRQQQNRKERLNEAEQLFSEAAEIAKNERLITTAADALLDRAQVRKLQGRAQAADSDVELAFSMAPDEPTVIAQMSELYRSRGDIERAVEMIQRAAQMSPRADIQYTFASALRARGKPGDYRKAAELLLDVALASPGYGVIPSGREHVISIAIECLGRDGRWEEAEKLLSDLPEELILPIAAASIRASLAMQKHENELANRHADQALSLVTERTDRDALAYLAAVLNELGRHKEALPLWQKVVRPGEPGPDPRRLLDTAYRLGRHDVILDVCTEFRKAGVRNPELLQYEITVLEEYDVEDAVHVIQEHLGDHPDDQLMRLRLSSLGIRMNRHEIVDADPHHMPPVDQVPPTVGVEAVRVMKSAGRPEDALSYGYELLRRHFSDPDAHRAYTLALLPIGPKPSMQEFETAEVGTAVCYVEENTDERHWIVIEDPPAGAPRFNDETSTTGPIARELIGKQVGERFTLAPSSISQRVATVVQILNKYVYRYQDCMGQWQVRFPEMPAVESFHMKRREDDQQIDISEILKAIDRRHEAAQELEKIYRSEPVPIHMYAAQLGKNAFEGLYYLASNEGSTVFCCAGTPDERQAAFDAVKLGAAAVLDLTSIATLMLLDCCDVLRTLPISLVVSQRTMAELQDMLLEQEATTTQTGYLSKNDSGYVMIEHSELQRQARISALSGIIELLRSVAKILPCRELAAFDADKRDILDKAFGRHGAEAILLASTPGRVLWTDDLRLAGFAATEHGVRRIWTQAMLQLAAERGSITPDQYFEASAKLLGYEYLFTTANPPVLMRAGVLADWSVDRWPLKQALDQFKAAYIDTMNCLQLAVLFLMQLYREPIPQESRDQPLVRILDNLATKPDGIEGIRAIQQAIPRVFGINLVGAKQCAECIDRWLRARSVIATGLDLGV